MQVCCKSFGVARAVLSAATIAVFFLSTPFYQVSLSAAERPNLIIILADDMGYDCASPYGGWIKTPNLQRLANEGMRFTDFHSSGTVCSPTRAGLVTGRYQQRAGIPGVVFADPQRAIHYTGLQDVELTFAESLQEAGYTTAIMGKWHLGYLKKYNPVRHGFDIFHGYVSGNVDYLSHYDQAGAYDWWNGLELVEEEGYSTHLINRHAVEFIQRNHDRPFCLYIAHEAVHSPFQGPLSQIERGPLTGKRKEAIALSKTDAYIQMMTEMDTGVGQVLDAVDRLGIAERTLVFFLSDNGHAGSAPEGPSDYHFPLRGHKGQVWEGGHRVPAFARWKGKIEPGSVNHDLLISIDLAPTMLELAGVAARVKRKFDGVSLTGSLLRSESVGQRQLFWNGTAMRDGQWKYVASRQGGGLFDLQHDLAEQNDLSERYPQRVGQMKQALAAWIIDVADGATEQPEPPPGVKIQPPRKKGPRKK